MTAFGEVLEQRSRKPTAVIVLPPAAFADDWGQKPDDDVAVGLRLISEADVQTARAQAARFASELFVARDGGVTDAEARGDAYNDALLRWVAARATCDPNDACTPYFECAEDTVRVALTSEGVRRLWDAYTRLHVGKGVAFPPANDSDLLELGARLSDGGTLDILTIAQASELRKLLGHCLEILRAADPNDQEAS